jgi:hypothetical protein
MSSELAIVFPAATMFLASLLATAFSLWIGTRAAPWFLNARCKPPTVRSYFLDPAADTGLTPVRVVAALVAAAILMTMLLGVALAVKAGR